MPLDHISYQENINTLSRALAEFICGTMKETLRTRGVCNMALSGRDIPHSIFQCLAKTFSNDSMDASWHSVNMFLTDEVILSPGHPDTNQSIISNHLIGHFTHFSGEFIYPKLSVSHPSEIARQYEHQIQSFFPGDTDLPVFDITVLGLTHEGSTASLVPGYPLRHPYHNWVLPIHRPDILPSRVVLLPKLLSSSRQVIFVANGRSKMRAVRRVIDRDPTCLASLIHSQRGKTCFFFTESTESSLK